MRLTHPIFNAALVPLYPALFLYTLHRRFVKKKSPASFAGQWGISPPKLSGNGPKIWLHAVSVGETMAARPIARALKNQIPGVQIALSSTTDTGFQAASALLKSGEVDAQFYFPLDLPFVVRKVLQTLRPNALLMVETELWPNLLHEAKKAGIWTALVNGRVSDNLLKTAPKVGPIWKWMASNVDEFLMRGDLDAARLERLGIPKTKISITGDVKLEAPPVEASRQKWREILGFSEVQKVWLAGSTHAGEEAIISRVQLKLREKWPDLGLIIAPRHIERATEVAALFPEAARRSRNEKVGKNGVFLLDSVGELGEIYAAADVAFVGGSLIERGGHNLLEPVLRGVPVLWGPWVMNFRAQAELLAQNQLGEPVEDENALPEAVSRWLTAPNDDFSARGDEVLKHHRGAAKKMAARVGEKLEGV